ncbi:MAG: LysE family transporter [Oscillospiraceae bacterium]|nr:LysE family transporter [Oscillospiraceae bacterium]
MTAVYLELAAYACATTFSPGPNNILLLSSTSTYGLRRCRPLILGIWTGLLSIMLVCGFCCAGLGELVPKLVPVAKYVGAGYVLYLAYKTLTRKVGDASANASKPLTYVNGFLLQFLNIKIIMLGIAAYSGYIMPHGFSVSAVVAFAVIMAGCAATGNLIWATLGTLLFPFYKRFDKIINAVMAALLVWCAWKIVSI